jgi:hypothetical protein
VSVNPAPLGQEELPGPVNMQVGRDDGTQLASIAAPACNPTPTSRLASAPSQPKRAAGPLLPTPQQKYATDPGTAPIFFYNSKTAPPRRQAAATPAAAATASPDEDGAETAPKKPWYKRLFQKQDSSRN